MTIALLASPVCMTRDRPPRGLAVGGALLQLDTMRLLELRATRIPGMGDHHDLGDLSTIGWVRVLATGDTLRLVALDARAVSARLAARPGEVPHRTRGSTIILTGDGEQTVAFLLRAFADPTLVSADTGEFVRVPR